MGHEVEVLTSSFPGAPREETIDGVKIRRIGDDWNVGIIGAVLLLLRRAPKADVVVDEVNVFPFWTPLVIKGARVLLLHHLAGDVLDRYKLRFWTRVSLGLLQRVFLALYMKSPVITPSPATREELSGIGFDHRNITLCPPGLPHPDRYLGLHFKKSHRPQVVYVGRVVPQKGIEIIIDAFQEVSKLLRDARLKICGYVEPPYRRKLRKLIDSLGLEEQVELTGFISESRKVRLLAESHVFVIHSAKEGWGIAAMEAMALGTPVVASNVPGLRDVVRHGESGWLVDYGNVHEFSRAIIHVLDEATRESPAYQEMTRTCRKVMPGQDFDTTARCVETKLVSVHQDMDRSVGD